jgi:hypothetical protein
MAIGTSATTMGGSKHFHHSKIKPLIHQAVSLHHPGARAPGNRLMYLFWIFHINGSTQCVTFCVWLSLSTIVPRVIHTAVCIHTSFLSTDK